MNISSLFVTSCPGLLEIDFRSWGETRGTLWKVRYKCKSMLWIKRFMKFGTELNPNSFRPVI